MTQIDTIFSTIDKGLRSAIAERKPLETIFIASISPGLAHIGRIRYLAEQHPDYRPYAPPMIYLYQAVETLALWAAQQKEPPAVLWCIHPTRQANGHRAVEVQGIAWDGTAVAKVYRLDGDAVSEVTDYPGQLPRRTPLTDYWTIYAKERSRWN